MTSNAAPLWTSDALVAASQLPSPRERQAAIQEAIERAQRKYPQFFNFTQGATQ